jgi:hypothetical protein
MRKHIWLAIAALVMWWIPGRITLASEPLAIAAAKKDPQGAAQADANEEQWEKLSDENWQKIQPELVAWAKKGKIYVARALECEDLPQADIPAFPGAEGGGMYTFGGRGGRVFVVTSLEDSGPGTLREACDAAGPRIVVFNVAGIIHLKRPLDIRAPYITIDGHTAPGDGVCVAGQTTEINTHDAVIRYMRFRRGITDVFNRDDALGGDPIGNVIVDHCSCSWGLDETLSLYRQMYEVVPGDRNTRLKLPTFNLTIQWSIITEGINKYGHAFGGTWGGRNSTFHHNLMACNTARNASIGMGYDFNFINNVIFNWQHRTLDGGDDTSRVNVIGNYYKPGPATHDDPVHYRVALIQAWKRHPDMTPRFGKWYVAGNYIVGYDKINADNWDDGVQFTLKHITTADDLEPEEQAKLMAQIRVDQPFPMAPVTMQTPQEAYDSVLGGAGATLPVRDPVDQRAVRQTRTGTVEYVAGKGIITDISQVGGYPVYKSGPPAVYSENDGIPDWWKKKYGLDIHDPNLASEDCNGDGYTNIEKYLDDLDPTKKVDWKDLKNNVNPLDANASTTQPAGQ